MHELARAREEITNGNRASAETILDGVLDSKEKISAHLLCDLVSIYDE
jgi:hypothetical protein